MWQILGSVAPRELAPARIQLHWAAQVISAAADAHLAAVADDSHTAMAWQAGALVGKAGVALHVADFALDVAGERYALDGMTLDDAMAWTDARLGKRGMHARDYDMPARPARFTRMAGELAELARYYANAAELLAPHASCSVWPHHFDLGGAIKLAGVAEIGVGMSPGDGSYAEPYLYVTPYPLKVGATLPPLVAGGQWSTKFTGAVMTNLALAGETGARAFVESAIDASRSVIA
ncbi:MAG TPA: hypothetical protein VGG28_03940 [Kofleriaceae bacterium]|jgi:hypothetical protein